MNLPRHLSLLLLAGALAYAPYARARDLWNDPFNTEKDLPHYSEGLHTPDCPAPPMEGERISVMRAVAIALCRNPDSKTTLEGLFAQAAGVGGTKGQYLPTISADTGWSKSTSFADHFKSVSIGRSSGISVGYTLYDFGRREASVSGAEFALEAAGLNYRSSLQQLIANTMQAYYALLGSTESVAAARESEAYAKEAKNAAELRYSIGQVPVSDQLQARAAHSQAQLALEQAQNQLSISKAALARLMDLPPDAPLGIENIDDGELYAKQLDIDIQQAMAKAKENRPDLEAQRKSLESSRQNYRGVRAGAWPTLSVSSGLSSPEFNPLNRGNTGRSQSVGLSLSIPIFTGFTQTYSERAAAYQVEAAQAQLEATEQNVLQDVWQTYQNYQTARASWLTSLDTLASTLQLKDVALGRYREGLGSILDLLNAQSQYSNSLQQNAAAKYNLLTTRIAFIRAIGALDLESASAAPTPSPTAPPPAPPAAVPATTLTPIPVTEPKP